MHLSSRSSLERGRERGRKKRREREGGREGGLLLLLLLMMMNTMGIRSMMTVTANITRRIIQENTTAATTTTTTTAAATAKERVEGLVLARGWLQRRHAAATATARNAGDAKEDGGGTNTQSAVGISEARKESRLRSLEEHSSVFDSFRQTKQVIDLQGKTVVVRDAPLSTTRS